MAESMRESSAFDSGKEYLGSVYAKALLGVTESAASTKVVMSEFDSLVHDLLDKVPSLESALSSPRIPHDDTSKLLDKMFAGKMNSDLLTFLKVVSRHGRLGCLRSIHRALQLQVNLLRGRLAVEVRTAEPIDADVMQMVAAKLRAVTGCDVEVKSRVDKEMLGGLIVRIGDTIYDGSVRNQLSRIREETLEVTLQKLRQAGNRFVAAS